MTATLLTLALLHWAVLVTPGPNVLVVTRLAASGQRRSALGAALGVSTVAGIWAMLAVLGVDAVFQAHAGARRALQVAGGLYLLHLALRLWRAEPTSVATPDAQHIGEHGGFQVGFLTNILNPKSALFFGSVFSTALPPSPPTWLMLAVPAIVFLNALAWHASLALSFSLGPVRAFYARRCTAMNRFAAALTAAFGLRLHWQLWRELASAET